MSKMLDILLNNDPSKVKEKPTREIHISRLSEKLFPLTPEEYRQGPRPSDKKFIITCQAISSTKYDEIQDDAVNVSTVNGNVQPDISTSAIQTSVALAGIKDPNLKDKELQKYYGAPNAQELLRILLLPGEITQIYNIVSELSGFGEEAVEEIKN